MNSVIKVITVIIAASLVLWSCGSSSDENKPDHYLVEGVAIEGYDPVAYFTESQAVKGSADFTHEYEGVQFQFASQEHLDLFKEDPTKYAPAYGGWCAYAIAEKSFKMEPDPTNWQIQDGELQLFYEDFWTELQGGLKKEWNAEPDAYKEKADTNWDQIVSE